MLKKFFIFLVLVAIAGGSAFYFANTKTKVQPQPQPEKTVQPVIESKKVALEDREFIYNKDNLDLSCSEDSQMLCAVDFAVKCTINPEVEACKSSKLPKFIFMSDASLERPTEISFKVHKIKPISTDLVEIHTNSTCNGVWFGLCKGRVIYVLVPDGEAWRVKDIYAIEDKTI